MKFICSYSGIECEVSHFPGTISYHKSVIHPIFHLKQKALFSYVPRALNGELTKTDSYLLYLALFNSTDLIEFRSPALYHPLTASIVAQNLEALAQIVAKMNVLGQHKVTEILNLPRYVISVDTRDLSTSDGWISIWEENYTDYLSGYKKATMVEKLSRRELAIEKMIRSRMEPSKYSTSLADWASVASDFEKHAWYDVLDENDRPIQMGEYWKRIIKVCSRKDNSFYEIPMIDLNDLIEHLEENLPHGSTSAATLMSILETARKRKQSLTDFGDIDLSSCEDTFRILDEDASIEDANKLALIHSAPLEEPKLSSYPSKIAYLRAKMNWEMAREYREGLAAAAKATVDSNITNAASKGE